MRQAKTTIYLNSNKKIILSRERSVEDVINDIKEERYKEYVQLYREDDGTSFEEIKNAIPAFTPNAFFSSADDFQELSGLVYMEVSTQNLEYIKPIPSLFAAWEAFQGDAYSLLFRVEGHTPETVKDAVKAISKKYHLYPFGYDSIDATVTLSADANLYLNPEGKPYKFKAPKRKPNKVVYKTVKELQENKPETPIFTEGKGHFMYKSPVYEIELYRSYTPINNNKRYTYLSQIAAKLIAIKAPKGSSKEDMFDYFQTFNNDCLEPLSETAIQKIFNSKMAQYKKGKLSVGTKIKYGKVNPNLSRKGKSKASQAIGAEVKVKRTKEAIKLAIIKLREQGEKVIQATVAKEADKGLATVKRYWADMQELLETGHVVPATIKDAA